MVHFSECSTVAAKYDTEMPIEMRDATGLLNTSLTGNIRVDIDVDVGGRRGVVPEGQGAVAVQYGRDGEVVVEDPGDVGGGDETADDPPESFIGFICFVFYLQYTVHNDNNRAICFKITMTP